jgi:polyhydroxybutyrate depolymerase
MLAAAAIAALGLWYGLAAERRPSGPSTGVFSLRPKATANPGLPSGAIAPGLAARPARGCTAQAATPIGQAMTTPSGRKFHVWGPASYDAARAYPVVLVFHGWTSSGPGLQKWFKMEDHVGGAAFTVYPDSQTAKWDFSGDLDLDFTAAVIDGLADAYCIDRARVLALGFSYGGRFVNHLACKRPELLRGVVSGGGSWDPETGCKSPMPVLVIHRTRDKAMPIAGGRASAARWAKVDGCGSRTTWLDPFYGCIGYEGCAAGAVTFCEDTQFDESWPAAWHHTVREEYRDLAWRWFLQLP